MVLSCCSCRAMRALIVRLYLLTSWGLPWPCQGAGPHVSPQVCQARPQQCHSRVRAVGQDLAVRHCSGGEHPWGLHITWPHGDSGTYCILTAAFCHHTYTLLINKPTGYIIVQEKHLEGHLLSLRSGVMASWALYVSAVSSPEKQSLPLSLWFRNIPLSLCLHHNVCWCCLREH